MTKDEALKLAMEALSPDPYRSEWVVAMDVDKAITAIKEALAQPEQEPVAWMTHSNDLTPLFHKTRAGALNWQTQPKPLYTTPPQRKPLTDDEIILIVADCAASHQHTDIHFARAIERAHGIKELV